MCTRVAAERHLSSGGVCVRQPEVPVFIDTHGGRIHIPARVAKEQVFKAWQHLGDREGKEWAEMREL